MSSRNFHNLFKTNFEQRLLPTSLQYRVATVREKSLENEIFSRSGKSQGISILVREI